MAAPIDIPEMEDAKRDAGDFATIVNGTRTQNGTGIVQTRYGGGIPTVNKVIGDAQDRLEAGLGYNFRGDWAGGTAYAARDQVRYNGVVYYAVVAHVSGDFTADLNAGRWRVYQGVTQDDDYMKARDILRAHAAFGMVQQQMLAESPVLQPSNEFIKAMMTGTVTIVVCGDSITAGSDYFYSNGWVQVFADMLREQVPWIKWIVINRSIGGRNLYQVSDPAYTSPDDFEFPEVLGGDTTQLWPLGTPVNGKAWRDYIRDDAPDMLIIAHQENHVDLSLETAFDNLKAYTDTWPKKPWFTVVSSFLPVNETNPDYGDAFKNANTQRQALADWWRSFAMRKGYGLIDVNGVMRMLRDGVRRNVVPLQIERFWRFWGDPAMWGYEGAPPTLAGSTMSFPGGSYARRLDVRARDVDFNANFTRGAENAVARVLSYRMTGPNNLSGYSAQYIWSLNQIQLYRNNIVIGVFDATPAAGPATATVNIRVRAFGNLHRIWVRGKLVAEVLDDAIMFAGETMVGSGQGELSASDPQFGWAVEQAVAPQYYTNRDMFGSYPASYLYDPDSPGGDLIHHMSRIGVYLMYLPAVQVWLRQFKALFERAVMLGSGKRVNPVNCAGPANTITNIEDTTVTFTIPRDTFGNIGISFGYTNPNDTSAQLHLLFDGVQIDEWYLPKASMQVFSVASGYLLGAGTHTLSLRVLNGGDGAIATGGGGQGRHLTLTVMPA